MRKEAHKFHLDVLGIYKSNMYDTLIHPNNITSDLRSVDFEEYKDKFNSLKGYFAAKEDPKHGIMRKYWIDEDFLDQLPVRVKKEEFVTLKNTSVNKSVIIKPTEVISFRIKPEQKFYQKPFIDSFADFDHTCPTQWTLMKNVVVAAQVCKTFMGLCSRSEFGKSSMFEIMDAITDKCPVLQPRSVPGAIIHINTYGNMVYDEVQNTDKKVKDIIENLTLQIAGNKPDYINGALKTHGLKTRYNCVNQSITFLYNELSQYPNEKDFFDYVWTNRVAMESRILKLKFDGVLSEKFDKNFDMVTCASENRQYYIDCAKHLLWLQEMIMKNQYKRRYTHTSVLNVNGRRKQSYDCITLLLDMYSTTQDEFSALCKELDKCITNYRDMTGTGYATEEVVE